MCRLLEVMHLQGPSPVGQAAAQDGGLSEGEGTHKVGVEYLQGAVAQQEREFRELELYMP